VLFYLPYAGLIERSRLELSVIEELSRQGVKVDLLRCGGTLPGPCPTKSSIYGEDLALNTVVESTICANCRRIGKQLSRHASVNEIFLEDVVDKASRTAITELAAGVTESTWQDFHFKEIPIGRYAAYIPLMRAQAISPSDLTSKWQRYVAELEACLLVAEGASKILSESRYDLAIVSNGLYGPDRTFHKVMSRANIPVVVLDGSALAPEQVSVLHGYWSDAKYFHAVKSSLWESALKKPLAFKAAQRAVEHHKSLTDSSSPLVYSSKRRRDVRAEEVFARLDIPRNAKVVVFTVSSPDEDIAREYSGDSIPLFGQDSYAIQIEVIRQLLQYAELRPDVSIVIRLHPRLFELRKRIASPAIESFLQLACESRPNVRINTPDQNLSLYDLIQVMDVGVTFQSSTALEFLAVGLPVVVGTDQFLTCPHNLVAVPSKRATFTELVDEAIAQGPSITRAINAFRWWGFVSRYNRLDYCPQISELSLTGAVRQRAKSPFYAILQCVKNLSSLVPQMSPRLSRTLAAFLYVMTSRPRLKRRLQSTEKITANLSSIATGNSYLAPDEDMNESDERSFLREHLLERFFALGYDLNADQKVSKLFRELVSEDSESLARN